MGLTLNALSQGREILHDEKIESLGDTVKIRELSTHQLDQIFNSEDNNREDGKGLTESGVKELLMATLTDDEGSKMTIPMCDQFFSQNQNSVIKEITDRIISVHGGSNTGES